MADGKDRKNGLRKAATRKFFHAFNDKSTFRRRAFCAALAVAPAFGIYNALETDASATRGPEGQARFEAYQKEISDIKAAMPTTTFKMQRKSGAPQTDGADVAKLEAARRHAAQFAVQIVLDDQISEADLKKISSAYNREIGRDIPIEIMNNMRWGAPFAEEARGQAAGSPDIANAPQEKKAEIIADIAHRDASNEFWISLAAFLASLELLTSLTGKALRHGSSRDDERLLEERREKFAAAKEDLEKLLRPKSSTPPPKI